MINERNEAAGSGDPGGDASGAGRRPDGFHERGEAAGARDPDGRAGGAGESPRGIAARGEVAGGRAGTTDSATRLGLLARLGLAIAHPRWALAIAADRRHAGRSGSDLIAAIVLVLVATHLRGLSTAVWLGSEVAPSLGVRAAIRVLTGMLVVDLGLLVIGALAVFVLAGSRRSLGRAFDLACVAVLPLLFVDLAATVVVRTAGLALPSGLSWLLTALSYGWMGSLIALATRSARVVAVGVPAPPAEVITRARRLGWGVAALAAVGIAAQVAWITNHVELVKPMTTGEPAPAFELAEIDPTGQLGERVALSASLGKVTVLDFWATWCKPCIAAMPRLEQLARTHRDVAVVAINLDDPVAARALFNERGYTIKLLADDGDVSQRYGVSAIPHTVVIDRSGVVRDVIRGAGDFAAAVEAVRASR